NAVPCSRFDVPESGNPVDLVERELVLLARNLELTARRSDLFGSLDRASYLILRILDERGPASISALAAALGLDGSTVTRQVATLARRGLIDRDRHPSDRRLAIVRVSQTGHERMREVRDRRRARFGSILEAWPPQDRIRLAELLARLNAALGELPPEG
ncbi:MAG: MarR family transcriptional regulator, partial [Candidatus Dormibacteraeota bacterium]|nr:MarR family transcriptional regulator [Candidatus Dormibacteraeota bacterium]